MSKGECSGSPSLPPENQKRLVDKALEQQFAQFIIKDQKGLKESFEGEEMKQNQGDNKVAHVEKPTSKLKPNYRPFKPKAPKQNSNYNTPPPGLYPQVQYEVATPQPYQTPHYMNYAPGHYSPNVIGYPSIQPIHIVPVPMGPTYFQSYVGYQPIPQFVPKSPEKSKFSEAKSNGFTEQDAIEVIEKFEEGGRKNSALSGTVVRLANTQNGSRFLQKQLAKGNPEFVEFILKEVI